MIHRMLKLCILICSLPLIAADAVKPYLELEAFDRQMDTTYVYLSSDLQKALLKLEKSNTLQSDDFKAVCDAARAGHLVATYDQVAPAIEEALNYLAHQKSADSLNLMAIVQTYRTFLESGDALVEFEDAEPDASRGSCCKSSKAYCRLFVRDILQVCGNLIVNGATNLNSILVQNNITVVNGTVDAPQGVFGAPSLIPFASGKYTITGGTILVTALDVLLPIDQNFPIHNFDNGNPIFIGFGDSATASNLPVVDSIDFGAYAFDVPEDGILIDLQASVDTHFVPPAIIPVPPATQVIKRFRCELYLSECAKGKSNAPTGYVPTGLFTNIDIIAPSVVPIREGKCVSACSNNTNGICVHKGDRVVLVVTMTSIGSGDDQTVQTIDRLAVNAGVFYTPTSSTCQRASITEDLCPAAG